MDSGRPRILSIIPYKIFPANLGGEKGIAVFNEYLAKTVTLTGVTTRNNDPAFARGYELFNIISNSRLRYINVFLYFTIRKMVKQQHVSHLLIEHPYYGWLAWMIRKTTNVQWLVHSHNMEYMRSQSIGRWWWRVLKWYESWVYRKADKLFFISEDDREHAIQYLGASKANSMAVTYGIMQQAIPNDTVESKNKIAKLHNIPADNKILLFNGALYHSTNYDALRVILDEINPVLLSFPDFKYTIVVCGRGLPDFFNELKDYSGKNVVYAGFVDDINLYFKAADIFLNPILSGGGVKTKAIEALAMNCTVVSTPLGALGLKRAVCGEKLKVIPENNWKEFSEAVIDGANERTDTPKQFFEYYYWGNIIESVVDFLGRQHA